MAGIRSSARQAAHKASSSPNSSQSKPSTGGAGSKRKASGAAAGGKAKKGKKAQAKEEKEQTTIEDTMPAEEKKEEDQDVEMRDEGEVKTGEASNGGGETGFDAVNEREAEIRDQEPMGDEKKEDAPAEKDAANTNGDTKAESRNEPMGNSKTDSSPAPTTGTITNGDAPSSSKEEEPKKNGFDTMMDASAGKEEDKNITAEGTGSKVSAADNAVESSSQRAEATPSSILEKGVIYFFFRGRVGINEPSDVNEIARSYIVLRPMPHGAKIGEGPIGDAKNVCMLSLPKKVLPVSPKDRFMTFVEKANVSMEDVKQQLSSSDYSTKTVGVRHTPAAAPIGEGVYAITKTERETHLVYILTVPSEINEVQKAVGLRQQGSYITSAKNPKSTSPANASLPKGAEYPQE